MSNANLNRAARAKCDEFYTQLSDIERELERDEYRAFFSGKVVYSNCDDWRQSQFIRYFVDNFAALGLKKFIATGMNAGYLIKTAGDVETGELAGNGDFRSDECVEILREADVVVTNPPFSLFREYVAQLVDYRKKFAIIGPFNAITYKEIFPLIKNNRIWLGYGFNRGNAYLSLPRGEYKDFADGVYNPETGLVKFRNMTWYTNIPLNKYKEELPLTFEYSPERYPKYDNYDAIEVSRVAEIPCDYYADMGVPITYLDKHNPEQFEIVKFRKGNDGKDLTYTLEGDTISQHSTAQHSTAQHRELRRTSESSSGGKCNGVMGVPITFLDKYNPEQFEILGCTYQYGDCGYHEAGTDWNGLIGGKSAYKRLFIRRKCNGVMGVPITFLDKYNPEQFEILGATESEGKGFSGELWDKNSGVAQAMIGGKKVYKRLLIRRRPNK